MSVGTLTVDISFRQLRELTDAFRDLERATKISNAEIAAVAAVLLKHIDEELKIAIMTGELPRPTQRRAISFRSDLR